MSGSQWPPELALLMDCVAQVEGLQWPGHEAFLVAVRPVSLTGFLSRAGGVAMTGRLAIVQEMARLIRRRLVMTAGRLATTPSKCRLSAWRASTAELADELFRFRQLSGLRCRTAG